MPIAYPTRLIATFEAVLDIAHHHGGMPVQGARLNQRQGHPPRYLEPVLQKLVRAGILESVRGPRGGYRLARKQDHITLAEIALAVSDNGIAPDPATQSALCQQLINPVWNSLLGTMVETLRNISVADLTRRAREIGIVSEHNPPIDYSI